MQLFCQQNWLGTQTRNLYNKYNSSFKSFDYYKLQGDVKIKWMVYANVNELMVIGEDPKV